MVEVRARDGRVLGYLPPDDAEVVAGLLDVGTPATACVSGIVPASRHSRMQLLVELPCDDGGP